MSNQSLRERFGLSDEKKNTVAMSRLTRARLEEALIKEEDEGAGAKYRRYIRIGPKGQKWENETACAC